MDFYSMNDIRDYILSQSEIAIRQAQEKIFNIITDVIRQFYSEFHPSMYEREEQLYKSLVRTDVKRVNNDWVAEVYFDFTQMEHTNRNNRNTWSEEKILNTALVGEYPHGGYAYATGNTQIWTESVNRVRNRATKALKDALIDNGILIR